MKVILIGSILLSNLAFANKSPCGLEGTLQERLKDCKEEKFKFQLVSRSKKLKEVWRDSRTGFLYSDKLQHSMTFDDAKASCESNFDILEGIDVSWKLPHFYEPSHVLRAILPNMKNNLFWVTAFESNDNTAAIFTGDKRPDIHGDGYISVNKNEKHEVRCTGRPKCTGAEDEITMEYGCATYYTGSICGYARIVKCEE